MDIISFLDSVPLFKGLPPDQLGRLAGIAAYRTVKRGETVFSEGEEANGFYLTVRGRVKVFKLSPDGKEQILHIIGFQEPFGEVPVFSGGRFPANAQAIEDALLIFLPRPAFVKLIETDPSLAMNMLALLSRRLRQFTGLIEGLSLKEVPARLASYLIYLSDRTKKETLIELDIPKTLLANVLGTIPETLSRILSRMAADGLIEVEGRKIKLLDRDKMERLSSGLMTL
ncbi:MAG: cAMP receptor protein [Syntrophorhabdaceae bacterium PtaU1.Bin034]|nr:MAG: cAMP receptor protein [Syntrophorhabdaceae bacterium PtaU1.Bin034]